MHEVSDEARREPGGAGDQVERIAAVKVQQVLEEARLADARSPCDPDDFIRLSDIESLVARRGRGQDSDAASLAAAARPAGKQGSDPAWRRSEICCHEGELHL